jgi:hypothetical protein
MLASAIKTVPGRMSPCRSLPLDKEEFLHSRQFLRRLPEHDERTPVNAGDHPEAIAAIHASED